MHLRSSRILTLALTVAAAVAVPAAAQAKPHTATVLRIDRAHHKIELVNSRHLVSAYSVAGRLLRHVARGSVVSYSANGKRVTSLRVKGRAHKLAFYGKVVASSKAGVVLQLADGRRVRLGKGAKAAARAAGTVSIQLVGLKPGQTVLITESFDGNGNVSITIQLVPGGDPTGGSGGAGGSGGDSTSDKDAVGAITAIAADGSTLTIQVDGQGAMTFQTDADLVDGFQVGDTVDVSYFKDTDGSLVADDVAYAPDNSGGDTTGDQDAVGTVTAIADDGSTVTIQVDGQKAMTFQTDADLVDGFQVGDVVDVTYYTDTDGSLVADDVEYADDSGAGSGS